MRVAAVLCTILLVGCSAAPSAPPTPTLTFKPASQAQIDAVSTAAIKALEGLATITPATPTPCR
jgi:hypothetical protein